jgi:hypothetical protein
MKVGVRSHNIKVCNVQKGNNLISFYRYFLDTAENQMITNEIR